MNRILFLLVLPCLLLGCEHSIKSQKTVPVRSGTGPIPEEITQPDMTPVNKDDKAAEKKPQDKKPEEKKPAAKK